MARTVAEIMEEIRGGKNGKGNTPSSPSTTSASRTKSRTVADIMDEIRSTQPTVVTPETTTSESNGWLSEKLWGAAEKATAQSPKPNAPVVETNKPATPAPTQEVVPHFSDYSSAVKYLKDKGIDWASGIMTEQEWRRRGSSQRNYNGGATFNTYEEYLDHAVSNKLGNGTSFIDNKAYDDKLTNDIRATEKEIEGAKANLRTLESPDVATFDPKNLIGKEVAAQKETIKEAETKLAKLKAEKQARGTKSYDTLSQESDFEKFSVGEKAPVVTDTLDVADMVYAAANGHDEFIEEHKSAPRGSGRKRRPSQPLYLDDVEAAKHFLPNEKRTYNYLYNKYGKDYAKSYFYSMKETLNARYGKARAEETDTFGEYAGLAIESGATQFLLGAEQLFDNDAIATPASIYAAQEASGNLGGVGKVAFDLTQTVSNMVPSLAIGAVNPIAGVAVMGASASGNAYNEKIKEGYSVNEARTYSVLVGASEALTQYLLGGIGKLGGVGVKGLTKVAPKLAKLNNVFGRVAKTVGNKALGRVLGKIALSASGEGLEEGLQPYIASMLASLVFNEEYEAPDFEEVAYSALLGFLSGGLLEGPSHVVNEVSTRGVGKDLKESAVKEEAEALGVPVEELEEVKAKAAEEGIINAIIEEGLASDENSAAYKVATQLKAKVENGETISNYELGRLYGENVRLQPNAEISPETANDPLVEAARAAVTAEQGVSIPESAPEVAPEMKTDDLLKGYGDYGKNAFRALAVENPNVSAEEISFNFKTAYEAGRMNTPLESMKFSNNAQIKAYQAGRYDAITDIKPVNKGYATVYGKEAGFIDTNQNDGVDVAVKDKLNGVAKALGVKVMLVGDIVTDNGENASGNYRDGVVLIKRNSKKPELKLVIHEITHHFKKSAPVQYQQYAKYALDYISGGDAQNAEKLIRTYQEQLKVSEEEAFDEVVADFAMRLDEDELVFKKFTEDMSKTEETRTVAQKFFDAVREIIGKIKQFLSGQKGKVSVEVDAAKTVLSGLEKVEQLWREAYEASVRYSESHPDGFSVTETNGKDIVTNKNGEVVAEVTEDGTAMFSRSTYAEDGRDFLDSWLEKRVKSKAITKEDATDIIKQLDYFYELTEKFEDKYAPFGAWSRAMVVKGADGKPAFSVVKANGEYKLNLDFSLVCKKRRTLDAVFKEMIDRGMMDDMVLDEAQIAKINEIIRKHGLETACSLCFVDSKRYRVAKVADNFVNMYNEMVNMLVPEDSGIGAYYFDFLGRGVSGSGKALHTVADKDIGKGITKLKKVMQENGERTVPHKIAKHLLNHPQDRRLLMRSEFVNSDGFEQVTLKNKDVLKLYNSSKGSGGPKASLPDVQYLGDILKGRTFTPKNAFAVGGVRIQSASDYIPRLVFDYLQMVAELTAKKLPAHSYSKEEMFVLQFGMTGIKINMSLVPSVDPNGIAPGLDANGNYTWYDGESFGSEVGKKGSSNKGFDRAVEIQNAEGYSVNVGTIAVGISKEHIEKMLGDDRIRMIIPYHASSLNPIVAKMTNINLYHNYTRSQNTTKDGKKLADIGKKEFNFNEALQRLGDARAAANEYLEWCKKNEFTPKFSEFAYHENYYKLLTDFNTYDANGNPAPQQAVKMVFPDENSPFGSMAQLIEQGLEEDAILEGKKTRAVPQIVDEVTEIFRESGRNYVEGQDDILEDVMNSPMWKKSKELTPYQIASITKDDANAVVSLPSLKKIVEKGGESSFHESIKKAKWLDSKQKALIEDEDDVKYYHNISNNETLNEANSILNKGGREETLRWYSIDENNATATDIAEGFILLKRFQDAGEYESAVQIARKLRRMGTSAGQTVQSFSILGRMTPEGMAVFAQKELEHAREEMIKLKSEEWVNKRKDMFELTEEEMKFIIGNIEKASKLPDGREKQILIAEISSMLSAKLPTTIQRQLKAFARNSMLFNTKTMLRNVLGNAILMPQYIVDDFISSAIDKRLSEKSGVRTKGNTLPSKESLLSAKKGLYESYDDFRRKINTRQFSGDRFEIGMGNDFRFYGKEKFEGASLSKKASMSISNALNKIDRVTTFLLDAGDRPFFEYHFTNSLNNQKRLNNTSEPTASMIDIATNEALERTWQNNSDLSNAAKKARDLLNYVGKKEWGLGNIIIPFVKTPANLARALVKYSPVGLIDALTRKAKAYKSSLESTEFDPNTQRDYVDSLAKGISGTILSIIAYALAAKGFITGGEDEDKDLAAFEKNIMGIAPYSVKIGNASFTYDWAQPIGGNLAIASDIQRNYSSAKNGEWEASDLKQSAKVAFDIILNSLSAGGNVIFDQSFLKGVSELFSADGFVEGLLETVAGSATQFVPSVLFQIAQIADPVARTSYVPDSIVSTAANKVASRVPFLRSNLAPVVDVLGNEVKGNSGFVNVFFNPSNVYKKADTEVANEIYRVYEETGNLSSIPRVAPYYFVYDGEKYTFTNHERSDYQKTSGKTASNVISKLLRNKGYKSLDDDSASKVLELVVSYSDAKAKESYLNARGVEYEKPSWMNEAEEAKNHGVSFEEYVVAYNAQRGIKSLVDQKGETIANSKSLQVMQAIYSIQGLTSEKRKYLFECFDVGKSVRRYSPSLVESKLNKMKQ